MIRFAGASLLVVILAGGCRAGAYDYSGRWEGTLTANNATRALVLEIVADTAVMFLPDEPGPPQVLGPIRTRGGELALQANTAAGPLSFSGRLIDGRLRGTLQVGNRTGSVLLQRTASAGGAPYAAEELWIPAQGATLAASLLSPQGAVPSAAMVLLHGSGTGVRSALHPVAHALAREGIAVMYYDKRGDGSSTGDWRSEPFQRLAEDAGFVVKYAARHPKLAAACIGLLGFSEGGVVAPMVAARESDVSFLVLVSTIATTSAEQDLERIRRTLIARGFDEATAGEAVRLRQAAHEYVRGVRSWESYDSLRQMARGSPWFAAAGWTEDPPRDSYWWRWYGTKLDHDPLPVLRSLEVPALVIFGGADLLLDPERNAALMGQALRADQHMIRLFPGADHNLNVLTNGSAALAPGYLPLIVSWIRTRTCLPRD